ncbi:hypothetical protein [Flavobacterium branchiophilum]|uniref:hypothetical protein n=1 Tax=Flavobacterium branchiophilum TaxID=55197 RepID=UPI0010541BAD|nr:hypothetical protein [Flavobacterium branchiophilum]
MLAKLIEIKGNLFLTLKTTTFLQLWFLVFMIPQGQETIAEHHSTIELFAELETMIKAVIEASIMLTCPKCTVINKRS